MAEKKNPYRFTLKFNESDPNHRRAVAILNQQGKSVSHFIVYAVLQYVDNEMSTSGSAFQQQTLEALIEMIVQKVADSKFGQEPPQREPPAEKPHRPTQVRSEPLHQPIKERPSEEGIAALRHNLEAVQGQE